MHGAPAVGKSSVSRVLQGLPPLPKPQQHSTEIFENPVRLIKTGRFSLTSEAVLEHVDEMKIMEMIASHIGETEKEEKHKSKAPSQPSTKSGNQDKNAEIQPPTGIVQPVSSETSPVKKHPTPQPMSDVIIGIAKLKKDGISSSNLFNIAWFHIMDSGGQPQFTDVLPLMFPKVSLHLVVIRLDEKLDDKPQVRYLVAGENKYDLPENLALSNLQMIQRTCELAEATRISSENKVRPWVMVIATHSDCNCSKESLEEKNRRLRELLSRYKHVLISKSNDEVIFAMNAMAPEGQERDKYTRLLQEHVLNAPKVHEDIPVPVRWMLFHLELSRCSDEGVVEKSVCLEVGDRIQMHKDDTMNAVKYFDSVALLMCLPDKLPDLILTNFDPFVSRLSLVLAASFTKPRPGPISEDRENLRTTGIVRKEFVEELFCGNKFNPHPFSVDKFFDLLEYLRIAVQIDENTCTYFIPCVLPLDDPNPVKFDQECSPILLTWCTHALPQGFFPALIVQLLRRKSTPCFEHSFGDEQLRRAVYLDSRYGPLLIVDQISWFELYFEGEKTKFPIILEAVEESSRDLTHVMKIHGYGDLKRAVRCPRVRCKTCLTHPGLIIPESNTAKCTKKASYRFPLSPEQKLWIKSSSGKYDVFLYTCNYAEIMLSVSFITLSVLLLL